MAKTPTRRYIFLPKSCAFGSTPVEAAGHFSREKYSSLISFLFRAARRSARTPALSTAVTTNFDAWTNFTASIKLGFATVTQIVPMGPTSPSKSVARQRAVGRTNSPAIMGTVFLDTCNVLARKNVPMDPMKNSAVSSHFIHYPTQRFFLYRCRIWVTTPWRFIVASIFDFLLWKSGDSFSTQEKKDLAFLTFVADLLLRLVDVSSRHF